MLRLAVFFNFIAIALFISSCNNGSKEYKQADFVATKSLITYVNLRPECSAPFTHFGPMPEGITIGEPIDMYLLPSNSISKFTGSNAFEELVPLERKIYPIKLKSNDSIIGAEEIELNPVNKHWVLKSFDKPQIMQLIENYKTANTHMVENSIKILNIPATQNEFPIYQSDTGANKSKYFIMLKKLLPADTEIEKSFNIISKVPASATRPTSLDYFISNLKDEVGPHGSGPD